MSNCLVSKAFINVVIYVYDSIFASSPKITECTTPVIRAIINIPSKNKYKFICARKKLLKTLFFSDIKLKTSSKDFLNTVNFTVPSVNCFTSNIELIDYIVEMC